MKQLSQGSGQQTHTSKKIRVAYLIDTFIKGGGTENQLAVLINNLDATRFESHLFTLRGSEQHDMPDVTCPVFSLNVTRLLSFRALTAIFRFVWFLRRNHIQVLQLYFIDSNIFGVIAGRLAGIRSIVVNRRDMGWWYETRALAWTNRLNRFVPYCLVNAHAVKEIVTRVEPFNESQITVICNGVALATDTISAARARAALGIPPTAPVVGIIANLKPIKRIDLFLRVAGRLPDKTTHFLIVGKGWLEEALKAQAQSLLPASQVVFRHTVVSAFDVLPAFDVGVLTSETEGLSNVLIEYALSGIPAVAFANGGNGEVITDGQTGFLVADADEEAMAEKIAYLIENKATAQQLGTAAKKRAREKFTVKAMVEKTEEFYIEVVERATRRR